MQPIEYFAVITFFSGLFFTVWWITKDSFKQPNKEELTSPKKQSSLMYL